MLRLDTRSVIPTRAIMQDAQPLGNRSIGEYPGKTMRTYLFSVNPKMPMPFFPFGACPQPASIRPCRFVDIEPESFFWGTPATAIQRTIDAAPFILFLRRLYRKIFRASRVLTDTSNARTSRHSAPSLEVESWWRICGNLPGKRPCPRVMNPCKPHRLKYTIKRRKGL